MFQMLPLHFEQLVGDLVRSPVEVPRTTVDAQELLEVDGELQHLFNIAFNF